MSHCIAWIIINVIHIRVLFSVKPCQHKESEAWPELFLCRSKYSTLIYPVSLWIWYWRHYIYVFCIDHSRSIIFFHDEADNWTCQFSNCGKVCSSWQQTINFSSSIQDQRVGQNWKPYFIAIGISMNIVVSNKNVMYIGQFYVIFMYKNIISIVLSHII